jgi:hypothetical protein
MDQRTTAKSNEAPYVVCLSNCFSLALERKQIRRRFLLDTSLSSSPLFANSSRHSVTSRIEPNSHFLNDLIFSTRHLNETPQKRQNVEKFNIRLRLFFAFGFALFPLICLRCF